MTTDPTTPDAGKATAELTRPDLVTYAIVAIVARCALSIVTAFSLYGARPEIARSLRSAAGGQSLTSSQLSSRVEADIKVQILLSIVGSLVILLVAKYIRDGKNWARWLYAVLVLLPLSPLSNLGNLLAVFQSIPVVVRLLSFLTGLAMLASVVLLFMKPSRAWFASMRPAGAPASPMGSLFRPRPVAQPAEPRAAARRVAAKPVDPAPGAATPATTRRAPRPKSRKSAEQ